MSCLPDLPLEASLAGEARPVEPCLAARIEAAGRYGITWPDTGQSWTLGLPRAKVGLGAASGAASGRVLLSAVRSGGEDSYFGVAGEAIVPEVQVAEARVDLAPLGAAAGGGVIDDAWVMSGESAWGLPSVAPTLAEGSGLFDRSDLGLWAAWTAPERWAAARVDLTTGEGARYRERNEGKDLAILASARPLSALGHPEALVVSGYGRQGSRGLGAARDHRAGARLSGRLSALDLGTELAWAWGVDGDASREAAALSAWGVAHPWPWALAWARLDRVGEGADAVSHSLRLGLGVDAVSGPGAGRVLVGWDHATATPGAMELAGAAALARTDTLWVQIDVLLMEER